MIETGATAEGVLYLYPDVYERSAFSVESLRAELQSSGVDAAQLNEQTLIQRRQAWYETR